MGEGSRPRALDAGEIAWVVLLPCAALALAAIVLLGPPLGHLLFRPGSEQLWPPRWWEAQGRPEPVKQGRYVLAALAPLLLAGAVLAGSRRGLRMQPRRARALATAGGALLAALTVVALAADRSETTVFGPVTIAVAVAALACVLAALRARVVRERLAGLLHDTRGRGVAAVTIAALFAAAWLLRALMTDRLAGDVGGLNLPYTMNDAVAVLAGRTPLVDFHVIYAKLLPYLSAAVLGAFGTTIFVYTAFMAALDALALAAVFATFRLVARSALGALALFVPFVAVGDMVGLPIAGGVASPMTLSANWPMRYGGAYLVAWLTARHVAARRPRHELVVFFVAGLATLNTLEFGLAATAATLAALVCARRPASLRTLGPLAARAGAGTLAAVAVVCLLTLLRAGALPRPALLLEWPRIFSTLGWFSLPLPTLGLHLALYATFLAAIVVAVVRAIRDERDVVLTSMLAWSGVFGLLAGSYFVSRPDVQKLTAMLSAWDFALAMLVVVVVRALAARDWRRPTVAELLVLFGFALSVCALGAFSPPQREIRRLMRPLRPPAYRAAAERFVARRTHAGERVAVLVPMGYRISRDLGLDNVAPYGFMNEIVTRAQLRTLLDTARRERVEALFVPYPGSELLQEGDTAPQQVQALIAAGYVPAEAVSGILELRRAR
ncbi:MAG: hypothetical protein JSS99_04585 [Actinobacteria bacterium]|nr:hypothetical protein [Actinomycetota bacterium]